MWEYLLLIVCLQIDYKLISFEDYRNERERERDVHKEVQNDAY